MYVAWKLADKATHNTAYVIINTTDTDSHMLENNHYVSSINQSIKTDVYR